MEASPPGREPPAPEPPSSAPEPTGPGPKPSPAGGFDLASAPAAAKIALLAALAVLIGSFGTWATVEFAGFRESIGGLDGDGALTLVLALLGGGAILLGLRGPSGAWLVGAIVCGILISVIGIIDFADVESLGGEIDLGVFEEGGDPYSVGWGLYLVVVGGLALTAAATVLRIRPD